MKNKKHSIFYKFDADTCVKIHYLLILLNSLVLGGGTIALMWLGILQDNNLFYIFSLITFMVYLFTRYAPGRMLQSVLISISNVPSCLKYVMHTGGKSPAVFSFLRLVQRNKVYPRSFS